MTTPAHRHTDTPTHGHTDTHTFFLEENWAENGAQRNVMWTVIFLEGRALVICLMAKWTLYEIRYRMVDRLADLFAD